MSRFVDFNQPAIAGREFEYMAEAVRNAHLSGNGPFTRRCEALLAELLGAPRVMLTTSGTHALEMAALLLDLQPGDEVILPSFTFVSTANAFALRGARLVFADIREETLNIDERQAAALITTKTRAIVPVHYAGIACAMDDLTKTAGKAGVAVIEDNAHGLFAAYHGKSLGTFGRMGIVSFHETKNIMCGEGGALILNEAANIPRAEIIREKGTNRACFNRGETDKYTWVDLGSSYIMSDILAAFLWGQLEERTAILARRATIWRHYSAALAGWARAHDVRLPVIPNGCEPSYHSFAMVLPTPAMRDQLLAHLRAQGVYSVFHYQPLHLSPMGRRHGSAPRGCPVTEHVSACLLRLPFHCKLTVDDLDYVCDTVIRYLP